MRHGQLSFDLIFSLLAALIFLQALNNVLPELEAAPSIASVRTQHIAIEKNLESMAMASDALLQGSLYLEYRIPTLHGTGFKPLPCTISIDDGIATVFTPSQPSPGISSDLNTVVNSNVLFSHFGKKKWSCGTNTVLINRT